MATVLYTSGAVHGAIKTLLQPAKTNDRRVVLVAYIGKAAAVYLPCPEDLHIICSPTPGATSGQVIRDLLGRGARVQFSDRIHMKVYWSAERGCIISSANVTAHALAASGLYEAGVSLPRGSVDIDRLIRSVHPREVTAADLRKLDVAPPWIGHTSDGPKGKPFDFLAWHDSRYRQSWKLGWGIDDGLGYARSAVARSKNDYGLSELYMVINAAEGQFHEKDWVLTFDISDKGIRSVEWMFVDFIVPVNSSDKRAYEKDYPFQLVQVSPTKFKPDPPFRITPDFRTAFAKAVGEYGLEKIQHPKSVKPPAAILRGTHILMSRSQTKKA